MPCLIWTGSDVFLSTTSILHLCAIAIHRYLGIAHPLRMRHAQECRHIFALIIPTWTISFAIAMPLIIQGARNERHVLMAVEGVGLQCGIFDKVFVIYSSMVSFFIPLAIMVFADIRSVRALRQHTNAPFSASRISRSRSRTSNNSHYGNANSQDTSLYDMTSSEMAESLTIKSKSPSIDSKHTKTAESRLSESKFAETQNNFDTTTLALGDLNDSGPPTPQFEKPHNNNQPRNSRSMNGRRGRSKSVGYISMLATRGFVKANSRERRAEKTLIWGFVCFVVLWFPFFCTNLIYGVCDHCNIPGTLFSAFTWLGYISSGVNPCIYTLLNQDFRTAFISLLTCRKAKLQRKLTT